MVFQNEAPQPVWAAFHVAGSRQLYAPGFSLSRSLPVSIHSLWCRCSSARAPRDSSCSCSAMIRRPMKPDTSSSSATLETHSSHPGCRANRRRFREFFPRDRTCPILHPLVGSSSDTFLICRQSGSHRLISRKTRSSHNKSRLNSLNLAVLC